MKVVILTLLLLIPATLAVASGDAKDIKGTALTDLPAKNPKKSQVETPAFLKDLDVNYQNQVVTISGTVKYKNVEHAISLEGTPYQSNVEASDVIFETQQNDTGTPLEVVFMKLYDTPSATDLNTQVATATEKTVALYFFDQEKRDLVSFEVAASELGLSELEGTQFEVKSTLIESWLHKVMTGEASFSEEEAEFSAMAGVSKSDVRNFSANITYVNPYQNGCDEQHVKNGIASVVGSTILADQNFITSNVKVNSQGITYNCGPGNYKYVAGESAIWLGSWSNPVKIDHTFTGTTYTDFVKQTSWWGSYTKRPLYSIDVGLSVGYGPISAGTSIAKWSNYKPTASTLKTVYFGDTSYSRLSNFKFTNSRLFNNGHYYSAKTIIGVAKRTTSNSKRVTAKVTLPIYGNTGGTYYTVKTYSPTITYSNY